VLEYDPDFTILDLSQTKLKSPATGILVAPDGLIGGLIIGTVFVLTVTLIVLIIAYKCRKHAKHEKQWKAAAKE
jgi:heme/copper-type cytochrome/quinol oxidase subunit 2